MRIALFIISFLTVVLLIVGITTLIHERLTTSQTMIVGAVVYNAGILFLTAVRQTLYPEKNDDK